MNESTTEPTRDQIQALFRRHGVTGEILEVVPRAGDEAIFLVVPAELPTVELKRLTLSLQELLNRKVWVVTNSPDWAGQSQIL